MKEENKKKICREIIEKIISGKINSREKLEKEKFEYCKRFNISLIFGPFADLKARAIFSFLIFSV